MASTRRRVTLAAVVVGALLLGGCSSVDAGESATRAVEETEPSATATALTYGELAPQGETVTGVVDRVVDGDTIHVIVDGQDLTVRMIGINTPETVKPNSPVECYGPESSEFAKAVLDGQPVTLEFDDTQGRTDQYDRTLAYVWVDRGDGGSDLFNLASVALGYAYERQYGPTPYAWKELFAGAQKAAQIAQSGLWGACPAS